MKKRIFCKIRWAKTDEWVPAMKMIWDTFLKYEGRDYTEEGIKSFLEFITDESLYAAFLRGEYRLMVALHRRSIIGAGSLRDGNRLSLLFVEEAYHRKGVGSAILWKLCHYLEKAGESSISLQAAPYAVDFYRKQGFHVVEPEREYDGIRVTLMEKSLSRHATRC